MSDDPPARCDECGAPRRDHASACARCGALPPVAPDASEPVEGPRAAEGWRLVRASTAGYALAQVALMLASGALGGVPWRHVAIRALLLAPMLAAPVLFARRRAVRWFTTWTLLLCAGVPAALGFMALGVVPSGPLPALTLATGALWAAALAVALWRVRSVPR